MSCVLRVSSPNLKDHLPVVAVKPYRVENGCAHFAVSACDFDNLPGQINDAIAFLQASAPDVSLLMSTAGATGVLDFATEAGDDGFQFRTFPAALVRDAGAAGLSLEFSLYPGESS